MRIRGGETRGGGKREWETRGGGGGGEGMGNKGVVL